MFFLSVGSHIIILIALVVVLNVLVYNITSHNPAGRGHRTGSSHSGALLEEYPQGKNTSKPKWYTHAWYTRPRIDYMSGKFRLQLLLLRFRKKHPQFCFNYSPAAKNVARPNPQLVLRTTSLAATVAQNDGYVDPNVAPAQQRSS